MWYLFNRQHLIHNFSKKLKNTDSDPKKIYNFKKQIILSKENSNDVSFESTLNFGNNNKDYKNFNTNSVIAIISFKKKKFNNFKKFNTFKFFRLDTRMTIWISRSRNFFNGGYYRLTPWYYVFSYLGCCISFFFSFWVCYWYA